MISPICSYCGSIDYEKAGWRSVKPTLDNGEKSLKLLKILWITENPLDFHNYKNYKAIFGNFW